MSTSITVDQFTSLLGGLYDCESTSQAVEPAEPIGKPEVVATYADAEGQAKYALVCDLSVANSMGAALTRIPPGGAEDATRTGQVPDNLADNLHEVLNICSAIFSDVAHDRIVLGEMFVPGKDMADGFADELTTANCLLQIQFELDRYQSGKLTFVELAS